MESIKIDLKDLIKTLAYLDKKGYMAALDLSTDILGRLQIRAGDHLITIYNAETQKFPTVTEVNELR